MIKNHSEKNELLQDFLHSYLNYIKDELLPDGNVKEAQIILSKLNSHLYLWDQTGNLYNKSISQLVYFLEEKSNYFKLCSFSIIDDYIHCKI